MRTFSTTWIIILCTAGYSQNPFIGKWKMYDVLSFKKLESVEFDQRENFSSHIIFKKDMTFEKSVNGTVVNGKYEVTSNKLIFYEKDENGVEKVSWSIRWPKNTNDPMPRTKEIDICYPELLSVNGRLAELDVYYIKE